MKKMINLKKRKTEKIPIEVPEIPITQRNPKVKDEEIYVEKTSVDKKIYTLQDCKTVEDKVRRVEERIEAFSKKLERILHTYYFLKLYSWVVTKYETYREQIKPIDKGILELKRHFEQIKEEWNIFLVKKPLDQEFIQERFIQVQDLFDAYREIESDLLFTEKHFYPKMKMSSYSICTEKSSNELESLHRNVQDTVRNYKNIHEAYDDISYHSGELIVKTVESLVECFQKSNNKMYQEAYNFSYFLNSSYILTFPYAEWVNLFNKLRYVMRTTNNIELFDYLTFQSYYKELEKKYMIVLIFHEMMGGNNERGTK